MRHGSRTLFRRQHRACTNDGAWHIAHHVADRIQSRARTHRDLKHIEATGDQCAGQRHRLFELIDRQHRHDADTT